MLKYLLFMSIALLSSINLYSGTWKQGADFPASINLDNLHFPLYTYGDSTVVHFGNNNTKGQFTYYLRYSLNGGLTWQYMFDVDSKVPFMGNVLYLDDWRYLQMNFFPPSTIQFFISRYRKLATSTDWGKTWNVKQINLLPDTPPSKKCNRRLANCLDTLNQILIIYNDKQDTALITKDGWKTYDTLHLGMKQADLHMFSPETISNNYGLTQYLTSDRGKTWETYKLGFENIDTINMNRGCAGRTFVNDTIFICGSIWQPNAPMSSGKIVLWKSTDQGRTWKICLFPQDSIHSGDSRICMSPSGAGAWITSYDLNPGPNHNFQKMYVTKDFGETWDTTYLYQKYTHIGEIGSCSAGSINNMWALYSGYLLKYDPNGVSGVEQIDETGEEINLYPNPVKVNSSINIKLPKSAEEATTILLYNSLGQLLDSHELPVGETLITYIPDNRLVPGAYYFLVKTNKTQYIKNFVVE